MKLKVALLQLTCGNDKMQNIANAAIKIKEAASKGAQLVVLPECFQSPYAINSFKDYAEDSSGPTQQMLSNAAKDSSVFLVGGSMPELDNQKVYNTSFVYNPQGHLIATHRKVHLFDINVPGKIAFQESLVLSSGADLNYFETPWGKIGLGICYDLRFPEMALMLSRKYGVSAMIYPGAFNMITGPMHWELLLRSRALDNQIFVAGCAPARDLNASYVSWGHSTSVNPLGMVLGALKDEEGILITTWDSSEIIDSRTNIPTSIQRRFDVYPDITMESPGTMDDHAIKKRKYSCLFPEYLHTLQKLSQVSTKKSELVELSEKLHSLSLEIRNRSPCFLKADELRLIMDWKLARGKFRPQLKKLIASNSSDFVESTTRKAFKKSWPENLHELTLLKGVGPATATAILTLKDDSIPFFSDEAAGKILGNDGPLKYSLKEVISYVEKMRAIVGKKDMTCRDYEIKIFIDHHKNSK